MNAQRLKLIAILSMTIDHLGVVFNTLYRYKIAGDEFASYMTDAYWQMRLIGRLAFPIFCFLVAEGCAYTKDLKKYIGRLAVFALIAQIPYQVFWGMRTGIDSAINSLFRFTSGNVLITLTLGAVIIFFYDKLFRVDKSKIFYRILFIMGIIASFITVILLRGEYDLCGLLIIPLVYVFRPKKDTDIDSKVSGTKYTQLMCCALVTLLYYLLILNHQLFEAIAAASSVFPLLLYNRKAGNRKWKWGFYIYYPAHMLILSAIMYLAMV